MEKIDRCDWANRGALEMSYHDLEWGVPVHDDRLLYEFLVLEGAQAGLSWSTVLKKRKAMKAAFSSFEPKQVARYDEKKIEELLGNPGIIRNRSKITAAIQNAQAVLNIQESMGSFDRYIWQFVGGKPIQNAWRSRSELPAHTRESEAMSKDLKQRGFHFVGSTICYAYMQGVGMVNDHVVQCFRHNIIGLMA
jgi:DNA-3-methyladenine glycosylase I